MTMHDTLASFTLHAQPCMSGTGSGPSAAGWNPYTGTLFPVSEENPKGDRALRKHIAVLTPAYGGKVPMEFVEQQRELERLCGKFGVDYTWMWIADSHIDRARSILSNWAMWNPSVTHMLWLDTDILAPDALHLLDIVLSGLPYVGIAYPKHGVNLQKMLDDARKFPEKTPSHLLSDALEFVVQIPDDDSGPGRAGPGNTRLLKLVAKRYMEVGGMGTGCLVQTRQTVRAISKHDAVPWSAPPPKGWGVAPSNFGVLPGAYTSKVPFVWSSGMDPTGKNPLWQSEDYYNGILWKEVSGKFPMIDVTKCLTHISTVPLTGFYGHTLLSGKADKEAIDSADYGPIMMRLLKKAGIIPDD